MPDDKPSPTVVANERKTWRNWHKNVRQDIRGMYDVHNPDTEATLAGMRATIGQLQDLIAQSRADGQPLRALGAGWSFSRAPATSGWMVNMRPLNWVFSLSPASLADGYAGDPDGLLLIQGGVGIAELNKHLETKRGRSLATAGASNGQTFAGAMGTGTHGSAIDQGAIQDHVVGLHVITGADQHYWIEAASYPVASEDFVNRLGARAIRDDAVFQAAVVSFGGFGIVQAVAIETVPRFLLDAYRVLRPYDATLQNAIDTLDVRGLDLPEPDERPYFLQVVIDPYNLEQAYVTVMYRRDAPPDYEPDYSHEGGFRAGYELLGVIGALNDQVPDLTPTLISKVTEARLQPFGPRTGTLGETFDFTTPRSGAAGSAIGVPLARASTVIRRILDVNTRAGPAPVVLACRFVRASKGTLAFTRFEPTCVIDIDGVYAERTLAFYKALWADLDAAGIPYTQHWGKINALTPERLSAMYGDGVDSWLAARRRLMPDEADRRTFDNRFMEKAGLVG